MTNAADRRSLRELLAAITNDLLLLGAQLFGIATVEGRVAAGAARNGVVVAILGAALLVCGVLTLVSALVLVIVALGLSPWAAALAVGVLLTLGGAVALHVGVDMVRHVRLHFPQTRGAITEGLSWLKSLQR
jgi:predicted phage tail protein